MSEWLNPVWISKQFEVPLSLVYLRFLQEQQGTAFSFNTAQLPTYQEKMSVWFEGEELESFLYDDWPEEKPNYGHPVAVEIELKGFPGWVPLATLGQKENSFLLVKADHPAAPISLWDYDTGTLLPVAESLKTCLEELSN